MEKGGMTMDPFDKSQTDPIWQRVWNRQPSSSPSRQPHPSPRRHLLRRSLYCLRQRCPGRPRSFCVRPGREEGFWTPVSGAERSMGTGGRGSALRLNRQAMERAACLRGMARSEQGGPGPSPGRPPGPVERALLRLRFRPGSLKTCTQTAKITPPLDLSSLSSARRWCRPSGFCCSFLGSQGR